MLLICCTNHRSKFVKVEPRNHHYRGNVNLLFVHEVLNAQVINTVE